MYEKEKCILTRNRLILALFSGFSGFYRSSLKSVRLMAICNRPKRTISVAVGLVCYK